MPALGTALLVMMLADGAPLPALAPPPSGPAPPQAPSRPAAPPRAPALLTAPAPDATTGYDLRPAKDRSGDLLYDGPLFSARVGVDGTVKFGPRRSNQPLWWPPFLPVPIDNGRPSLQSTLSSALKGKKQPKVETDKVVDESFLIIPNTTRYRPDPREGSRASFQPLIPYGASGHGDLTDALTQVGGQDPHRLEKARFLTATRDLRVRRAARAQAQWIREAAAELPQRLAAIAGDERLTVAERRALLEELAAEMDDTPAGREAAVRIRAFSVARFPPE
jgi:hypothetical protein